MGKTTGGTPAGVVDMTRTVPIKLPKGTGGVQTWTRSRPGSGTPRAKKKGGYIKRKKGGSARKG